MSGSRGLKGCLRSSYPITLSAPMVFPWYALCAAISSDLPVKRLANFKAPSMASVPEFVR